MAGRVLYGGVPGGVAIGAAQQQGGPRPASTMPLSTGVGFAASGRLLRPLASQHAPDGLVQARGPA